METNSRDEQKMLRDFGRMAEGLQLIAAELEHIRVLLEEQTKRGGALDMRPLHDLDAIRGVLSEQGTPMIAPMLCKDTRGDTSLVPDHWVMEPKLDGWRWIVHVTDKAEVLSVGGRNGKAHPTPPLLEPLNALPPDTILDGELVPLAPGAKSPQVSHLLAHGGSGLGYVVFDLLRLAGQDLTTRRWDYRRGYLDVALAAMGGNIVAAPVEPYSPELIADWVAQGFEGAVAKDPAGHYEPGRRRWLKIKPQTTMDAVVVGWEYGKGQGNSHLCGALLIELENGVQTSCAWRGQPNEADLMVGAPIEIRHHGVFADGKVRHPIYHRRREDLEPVAPKQSKPTGRTTMTEPGAWVRNYAAMNDDKLDRCIAELEAGEGDAYDRVIARQGSVELNLQRARAARGAQAA